VGIDTATLPVLLPAAPPYPELLLALSADRHTIMALEPLTGKPAWQHRLSAPSLGRPVIVDRKAYVATYDGYVHEIETALGFVLGHFELGQHLTVGGVRQEGTPLLYFPGDSDYVYVLDMAARKCVAILHTGHPSGSLRSEPIVVNRMDPLPRSEAGADAAPSYLILTQTSGLSHMKLRAFRLPIDNPDAPPEPPEPRIRGWSWFRPYHDGERLAFATDAGMVGLFGINQLRNEDTPLFPELPPPPEERKPRASAPEAHLIRGQVVHVVENDFWILADGKLERQHFDPFRQQMIPVWETPLVLGSPVHAAQVDESEKTLFVVTQDLNRQIYLATAVAAEDGIIKWQRQLGLECACDPLVLGREIVTVDRGGGLSIIDSSKNADLVGMRPDMVRQPELRGASQRYRPALPGGALTVNVLPGPDGTSVYEVACPAAGGRLTVRRYPADSAPDQPDIWERSIEEQIQLAGTPAIVGPNLLLPLADGTIRRVPLLAGHSEGGPNWRAARVDENARGHIVAVGPDDFLTTDGSRGLTHWRWPATVPMFQTVPENRIPTVELPARIVSAPVILPSPKGDSEWQVCVALADGTLARLRGLDLKLEQPLLPPGGQITAGPFGRGPYVGCVVDRRRLVWLDPKAGTHWEYRTPGEAIVGEPQLVGGLVVVADLSGRFIGLDPATGTPAGLGYTLKTSAAPAAAPAAFGTDAAFVPLTDGTVFVLALRHLRDPLAILWTLGP
ncbi:MAG TPA: PQQ-binding-like beta-propeller repeat protein, partial [Gemmataceae bacterium]|nr:PQQ-binding-like beta-propeller repeat protein [Gemmataceae bacterium]